MKCYMRSLTAFVVVCVIAGCEPAEKGDGKQAASTSGDVSYFFGARIIPGDGSPAMENMSFIVADGKFTQIGAFKDIVPPKGAARIEMTGRTVTPVFINMQAQPGMNRGRQYGPKNYTRESLTADLSRYAYYGVMAVLTGGTDAGDLASSVRDELRAGKIKGARLYTAGKGIAAKGGGPEGLAETTIYIASAADGKKAVADLANSKVDAVKIWMDNGNGKGAK